MLTVNEAWACIDEAACPRPAVRAALASACGRRLGEEVRATEDLPAFNRSAVDGYAAAAGAGAGRFRVANEVRPGMPVPAIPHAGEAVRIFTGSALPDSGSAVIMVEETDEADGFVEFRAAPSIEFVRRKGSQARAGDLLLARGSVLSPGAIALLAALGVAEPLVSPRLRAAHLTTGSELVAPDAIPQPGFIRDSNSPLIASLVSRAGMDLVFQGHVPEEAAHTVAALESVDADIYLIGGGASVGAHDGTAEALQRLGFTIRFKKVSVRPGKPLIFATRGNQIAFGLPGNPLSHFVCFHLFVWRAMEAMLGPERRRPLPVHLLDGKPESGGRETWKLARVEGVDGRLTAKLLPWADSSDLTGLAATNAILRASPPDENGLACAFLLENLV